MKKNLYTITGLLALAITLGACHKDKTRYTFGQRPKYWKSIRNCR